MQRSVAFLPVLVVLAASLPGSAGLVLDRQRQQARRGSYTQRLRNFHNVQYFADFDLGGQIVAGIFDTGSSSLLVRSTKCARCVHPTVPYNGTRSKTFKRNGTVTKHFFGSGRCVSEKGYEQVKVGPLVAQSQAFWEILDHKMPVLDVAKFAAIVGIGPDAGSGNSDTTLLKSFGVEEFSVCLKKVSDAEGYLTWGPTVTQQYKDWYHAKAKVHGQSHWSTRMTDVTLTNLRPTFSHLEHMPCMGSGCAVVIDSGTSLIAAPGWALMQLSAQLPPIADDCSNLKDLPTLRFNLDGVPFSLPPHAYVMHIRGATLVADSVWDILFFKPQIRRQNVCVPAFTQLDLMSEIGPVWILGMPFLRYYHTTFDRKRKEMQFAMAGPDCFPHPFYVNGTGTDSLLQATAKHELPQKPIEVDPAAIVPPRLSEMIDISAGNNHIVL